jgi:hypothetical protein
MGHVLPHGKKLPMMGDERQRTPIAWLQVASSHGQIARFFAPMGKKRFDKNED